MKKIIDNVIYVLTAALLITIVALKDNYFLLLTVASVGLIIIGILLFINKNNYAPILTPVGISLGISLIAYKYASFPLHKSILLFFMLSIISIMIFTLIKYHITLKENIKIHSMVIEAEVTDLVKNPNLEKDVYYPVLTYEKGSEIFDINYPVGYYKNIPNIGDKIAINVNPNDYMDVYFKPTNDAILKNVISGISVIVLATIVLIGIF